MGLLDLIYSKKCEGVYTKRKILGINVITKRNSSNLNNNINIDNLLNLENKVNDIYSKLSLMRVDMAYCNNFMMYEIYKNMLLNTEKYNDEKRLEKFGYKVFSQNEEDGILNEIFNRIGTTNKFFVEFGVQDGLECNSHYLLFQGWSGVFIEGSTEYCKMINNNFSKLIEKNKLKVLNNFITKENINDLIGTTDAANIKDIDLLSIDIDGNDYHIFNIINIVNPRVIVIEYNSKFPPPVEWIMPYDPNYVWKDASDKQSASLESITKLANKKNYQLVATDFAGVNAFFVRKDLCEDKFPTDDSAKNLYNPPRYLCTTNIPRPMHPNRYFLENFISEE